MSAEWFYNYACIIALISDSFSLEDELGNAIYLGVGFCGDMSILFPTVSVGGKERGTPFSPLSLDQYSGAKTFAAVPI